MDIEKVSNLITTIKLRICKSICRQNLNQESACRFGNMATFKNCRHVVAPTTDRRAKFLATTS